MTKEIKKMIFKILKEYIRRITRNYKIYAISILGMSIAIIASFHIYHFVYKELSVDGFHTKKKEVYRVVQKSLHSNFPVADTPSPLGELLKEKFPEVENYTRITIRNEIIVKANYKTHKNDISYIDASFFELFNFSLKKGSVAQFKESTNGIIISEKAAKILFGEKDPIGEIITYSEDYKENEDEFEVIGILNKIPENSTIQGDYFINIENYQKAVSIDMKWLGTGGSTHLYLYVPKLQNTKLFSEKATKLMFSEVKIRANKMFVGRKIEEPYFELYLQRLDTIYFNSTDIVRQKYKGNLQFLRIILLVGLLTLFLATTNYIIMNLGLNMNRVKEFKIRRFLGVSKGGIYTQLVIESLLNTSICFVLTLITYPLIGEFISNIIGFNYQLSIASDGLLLVTYFGIILLLGLIIGSLEFVFSYKSIFIERPSTKKKNSWVSKKLMIGFQLFLFIGLIICILFVGKQVDYIQNKDLGYSPQNVVGLSTRNHKDLKGFLETKSYVKSTSYSQLLFSPTFGLNPLTNVESNKNVDVIFKKGDYNFLKVNSIELLYGKNFPEKLGSDKSNEIERENKGLSEILVNEEFVRKTNLKDPIGKVFKIENYKEFVIIGVINNVYCTPLYYPVQPLIICDKDYNRWYYGSLVVSYQDGYRQQLQKDVKDFFVKKGVEPMFLDEILVQHDLKYVYKKEIQLKRLLQAFTIIVLFITLLGMIAISLFITESKTKEIGIRKVNGATIKEIMFMLNIDFIKWVGIAFVIACPIAYYAMSKWLENFAYKTSLSWWVFALAGLFTLIIALLTVSWQSWRAATRNPVEALRDE